MADEESRTVFVRKIDGENGYEAEVSPQVTKADELVVLREFLAKNMAFMMRKAGEKFEDDESKDDNGSSSSMSVAGLSRRGAGVGLGGASTSSPRFSVNEYVMVKRRPRGNEWYSAKIFKINDDNTYDVRFSDNVVQRSIDIDRIVECPFDLERTIAAYSRDDTTGKFTLLPTKGGSSNAKKSRKSYRKKRRKSYKRK